MALLNWQEKDFNDLMTSKGAAVIQFSAPWCGACKTIEPIISELANSRNDITFAKIDVSQNQALASKMGVMSLPNILVINDGKVINQIIGATSKSNIEEKIAKLQKV